MAACRAEDLANGVLYYCTLDAGHVPVTEHQTTTLRPEPPEDPVRYVPTVHSWTSPT